MNPSSAISIDNRIPLRRYYRIADTILKQADIYRHENNIIDLYVMLLRFSSLVTETIPSHRDYPASSQIDKRWLNALLELEAIKPDLNRNQLVNKQAPAQGYKILGSNGSTSGPVVQQNKLFQAKPVNQQFSNFSSTKRYIEKYITGQWQLTIIDQEVRYPSNLDLTPVVIPSLLPEQDKPVAELKPERSALEVLSLQDGLVALDGVEPSTINLDVPETPKMNIIRRPSPPPVLAEVQEHVDMGCQESGQMTSLQDELLNSESPLEVHISTAMMDSFMRLAKSNTTRNLETCGILAGSLKNKKFYITALIIPKQESTSDSCQATNEEEIFEYQDKLSLFPLGWIHTHPTQSCFMSPIDVHTHYEYQTMLPEAIAIVMAPKDASRKHGIFRLTTPGGMSVIRNCQQRGFHPHPEPLGGGPIYDSCPDVYMNPSLKFDVADLR